MENKWQQFRPTHCPDPKCKGMLLQNLMEHEEKCSDCGKFWISINKWVEVDDPNKKK
jgi:hypothetical protein